MAAYACPVHSDVVLFEGDDREEEGTVIKMLVFSQDGPRECPKCRKHYYRHECVKQ